MALLGTYLALHASDNGYTYLAFRYINGTIKTVKSQGLKLEVAENGKLNVIHSEGTETLNLADLTSMNFSSDPNSVEGLEKDIDESVSVYTPTGCFIGNFKSSSEAISIINESGVYVFKSKSKISKILLTK